MNKIIDETIGWIGISLILLAYALNTFGVIDVKSVGYAVMNIFGSLGVVYISFKKKDYQPSVLNAIWALIAIVGLARIFL
jgi:hypothetical protein